MGALTDNTIASTYKQLLKITSEGVGADASAKYVEDGLGTDTALSLSTTRIGIGTASPTHKLTVEGDATDGGTGNDGQLVLRGATNTNLRLMMGMDTSSEYGFISPMKLGTSWNNLSLCYNGGNVGIGDNSPATKLDVNGDIQIQGANAMILNHTTGAASDTYINSPSSDVMAFRTGGTERMRITSTGKVGIQTSSPSVGGWSDKRGTLTISSADESDANNYAILELQGHSFNSSGINGIMMFLDHTVELARIQSNSLGSNRGDIKFSTNNGSSNAVRMEIENDGTVVMNGALQPAGNVSIGGYAKTSNYFETAGGSGGQQAFSSSVTSSYRGGGLIRFFTDNNVSIFKFGDESAPYGGYFGTFAGYTPSGAELMILGIDGVNIGTNRGDQKIGMRVTSGGAALFGATSQTDGELFKITGSTDAKYLVRIHQTNSAIASDDLIMQLAFDNDATTTAGARFVVFEDSNTTMGSIAVASNTDQIVYNTSSDERLKENIKDASSQLKTINDIQVREFKWKRNGHEDIGVIAQELEKVYPKAVTKGGDNVNEKPYEVDYSTLVIPLIKAVQELSAKVEELKTELQDTKDYVDHKQDYNSMAGRINSCEARIASLEKE